MSKSTKSFMNSIVMRIMALFLAIGIAYTLILLITSFLITKSNIERIATEDLETIADSSYRLIENTDSLSLYLAGNKIIKDADDRDQISENLLRKLRNQIKEMKIGKNGRLFIMDGHGILVSHSTDEGKDLSKLPFAKEIMKNKNGTATFEWHGEKNIAAYRYYAPLDWHIIAWSNYSDFIKTAVRQFIIAAGVLVVILAALIIVSIFSLMKQLILKPLNNAKSIAKAIQDGDLNVNVPHTRDDEIGVFFESLEDMLSSLKGIIQSVKKHTENLSSSSTSLDGISVRMSQMSQDQAASMEQTSAALEETLASMEQIATKSEDQFQKVKKNVDRMGSMAADARNSFNEAESVSNLMNRTAQEASKGAEDLNRMVQEMQNIKESTVKIAEIIKIISDISEQVNLLSLNAAIEAARAGDHGKGFAVVADEISKLAEETATSAKTITNLVKEGSARADSGTEIVNRTASTFHRIIDSIEKVTGSISNFSGTLKMLADVSSESQERADGISKIASDVSAGTREQMLTNKEVSQTIEKVNGASQELVHHADGIMKTSDEIKSLSREINAELSKFKLS